MAGARRDLLQGLNRTRHERGPQQKVLGRVSRHTQLRKHDEVGTGCLGRRVRSENSVGIALEITNDDVDLSCGNPDARHNRPGYDRH